MKPELLNHAREYSAIGWAVIPTRGKIAACRWKSLQKERPGPDKVQRLFDKPYITGLAVIHGPVSGGLVCRDFDKESAYDRWASDHADLARSLPTVQTARGRHVYFRGPEGFIKFDDGEYRGTSKQYTLLPPSRHPTGPTYRWLIPLPDGELPLVDPIQAGLGGKMEKIEESHEPVNRVNGSSEEEEGEASSLSTLSTLLTIEKAIAATLPSTKGQRNQCVFRLARHLKGIVPNADAKTLRPFVEEWYQQALPVIGTKEFLETWTDFLQAWRKVRIPAGQGAIDIAFERAVASVPPPTAIQLYGEGPIILLAALCRELQRFAADGEFFFLDCRKAGRLIGVSHVMAWRYLEALCADGILTAGAKGSKATGRASRFRFVG